MKLDDNTRAALHYLVLGSVVLLVFIIVAHSLSQAYAPDDPQLAVLAPFKHGYLLSEDTTIVVARTDRSDRIATAVVASMVAALVAALLAALIARIARKSARRSAVLTVRWALPIFLCWGIWTAFFLPLHAVTFSKGKVRIENRRPIFGEIPVPFSHTEILLGEGQLERFIMTEKEEPASPCGMTFLLRLKTHLVSLPVAEALPQGMDPEECDSARSRIEQAKAVLDGYIRPQ